MPSLHSDRGSLSSAASTDDSSNHRSHLHQSVTTAILVRDHDLLIALLSQDQVANIAVNTLTAKDSRDHTLLIKIAPHLPSLNTAMTIALQNSDYHGAELLEQNYWTGLGSKRVKLAPSYTYGQLLTAFFSGAMEFKSSNDSDHTLTWLLNHQPDFSPALRLAGLNGDEPTVTLILQQAIITTGNPDNARQLAAQAVADLVLTELTGRGLADYNRQTRLNQKLQAIKLLCRHGATVEPALETLVDYLVSANQAGSGVTPDNANPTLAQLLLDNLLTHGQVANDSASTASLMASLYQVLQLWPLAIADNVLQFYLDQGLSLDGQAVPGETGTIYRHVPLRLAVNLDSASLVHRLIRAGADPNAWDGLILIEAARNNKLVALKALLQLGGDPNLVLDCYVTPLSRTVLSDFLVPAKREPSQATAVELLQQIATATTNLDSTELTARPRRVARLVFDQVCGSIDIPVASLDLLEQYLKYLRVQVVKRSRADKKMVTFQANQTNQL